MTVKTNTQEIAEYPANGTEKILDALNDTYDGHRKGALNELEALRKTGNAYDPKVAPMQIRENKQFGFYSKRESPLESLKNMSIDNHSIESELQKIRTIFREPHFYICLNNLRKLYTEGDAPYNDEDRAAPIVAPMRDMYKHIFAKDDTSYSGGLVERMLNGHFGMFDTNAYSHTSNLIHSTIICTIDPLEKHRYHKAIKYEVQPNAPYLMQELQILLPKHLREAAMKRYTTTHQAPTDFHYDMAFMFGMQAERWGINDSNYNDEGFQEKLATNMERWAKTVYASRALKMLEAQDEAGLTLSSDDATFLKGYIKDYSSNGFKIEQDTVKGLNSFIDDIEQAKNDGHNNAGSVLNKGYNLKENNGESIESKASLEWLKQAQKAGLFTDFIAGKTSAKQTADNAVAYHRAYG